MGLIGKMAKSLIINLIVFYKFSQHIMLFGAIIHLVVISLKTYGNSR
jgi:hypothetical protein